MNDASIPRPLLLVILDGFGESSNPKQNAVAAANTPIIASLKARFPHGLLHASGPYVGLPDGQMGNSEVGHMNIGSGRVLMQELPRIDRAISSGGLEQNLALVEFIRALQNSGGTCHLMGLLSPGGVHSHQRHMGELAKLVSEQSVPVKIHAFTDGRDTPPKSVTEYFTRFRQDFPLANFATVSGRYYAMDRDKRWERVELAYNAIAGGEGPKTSMAEHAIAATYSQGKTDEFVVPMVVGDYNGMRDGDGILMANFRADRAREILQALIDPNFYSFNRKYFIRFADNLGTVEYSAELNKYMKTLFPPEPITNILGEVLASLGLKQLRIAETEKYAHVTFFFNGGREEPFEGESRILIQSPKVATYDLAPEMSAGEVTDRLIAAVSADTYDFILVNFANPDMVGHTGNFDATVKAIEALDGCLDRIWWAVERKKGAMIVTSDHGNAEQMYDPQTRQQHTAHTRNPVPIILAVPSLAGKKLAISQGSLADIAPTVLKLLGIPKPAEMSGRSLI